MDQEAFSYNGGTVSPDGYGNWIVDNEYGEVPGVFSCEEAAMIAVDYPVCVEELWATRSMMQCHDTIMLEDICHLRGERFECPQCGRQTLKSAGYEALPGGGCREEYLCESPKCNHTYSVSA